MIEPGEGPSHAAAVSDVYRTERRRGRRSGNKPRRTSVSPPLLLPQPHRNGVAVSLLVTTSEVKHD